MEEEIIPQDDSQAVQETSQPPIEFVEIPAVEPISEVLRPQQYFTRIKLIQKYWLEKKVELVTEGMTPAQFDNFHKDAFIREAKLLYPQEGTYLVEEDEITYLGNI